VDTVPPNLSVWLTLGRCTVIPDLRWGAFRVLGLTLSNIPPPPATPSRVKRGCTFKPEPLLASR